MDSVGAALGVECMKVAFFDRDGTIIVDYPDNVWTEVNEPKFIDGAIEVLQNLIQLDYKIIIITNQYLINEEFITLEQYTRITEKLLRELNSHNVSILDIFYCPHSRDEKCECHKPSPGMINQAINKYPNINLAHSFMIGDSECDVELALNVGINGFGIGITSKQRDGIIYLKSIKELIAHIKTDI